MAARPRTLDREANEIMNNITAGETAAGRGFRSSLWWLIAKTQLIVDLPIWLGAYKREMAANPDDEVRAIAIADQAVRDTQGGGQVADLARIQQGASHARLFTALYSYFNATHNLLAESYRLRTKKSDYVGLAGDYLLLLTAPAMLAVAIRVLMSALAGEEWDEEKLVKAMAAEQLGFVLGTNVVFRELNVAATNLTGLSQFGTDYSGPAALTLVSDVTRLGQQINQGEADAALFRALISTAGVVFHLPSAQINRSLAGGYAFAQGEAALPAVLFGPPRD